MLSKMKSVVVMFFFAVTLFTPVLMSGTTSKTKYTTALYTGINKSLLTVSSTVLYDSLKLGEFGLNQKAFQYAWRGYLNLYEKGKITNAGYFSIADFSQSSRNKRLYIIDLQEMKLFMNTYVAHGRNSGGEFAQTFSNRPESLKSSLGFYITGSTYKGVHGLSLQINGIEKGINDKAWSRKIVIHGAEYVGDNYIVDNPFIGRSYGCPAVPASERDTIINSIKEGSCLFIYYPSKLYLNRSKILNG
ncbi:MAG TPA: murein L,D-transpeptidase catalytic domain family protein [Flavitalea sp.]|nr:murein L,D-transpeptidase catalytic domain family protein [Flavitalea sp.]